MLLLQPRLQEPRCQLSQVESTYPPGINPRTADIPPVVAAPADAITLISIRSPAATTTRFTRSDFTVSPPGTLTVKGVGEPFFISAIIYVAGPPALAFGLAPLDARSETKT